MAVLASLLVVLLCGWSLLAGTTPGLRVSSSLPRSGVAALEALPGDGVPPASLHHHVARKKPRQYQLAPASPRNDPAILPPPGAGEPPAAPHAFTLGQARIPLEVPAFASAPQLRLHPGQAPPAA